MEHPLVRWLGIVVVVGTVLVAVVGLYVFFDHLNQGLVAKRELDKEWLALDRNDHQAILDQCKAIQVDIKLLVSRLGGDGALLYQVGLRDGMALCRAQEK